MQKETMNKSEIKLIGLKTRTNNQNEMNSQTAKIGKQAGEFQSQNSKSNT